VAQFHADLELATFGAAALTISARAAEQLRIGNTNDLRQRSLRPWVLSP
jgi:hypothetical protein